MKRFIIAATFFSLFLFDGFGQLSPQDKLVLEIPATQSFTTSGISSYIKNKFASDSERVRAAYVWIGNNISYDVDKVRFNRVQEKTTVEDVLKFKKAICQGYAELMVQLCKEIGVNAELVTGYTKNQFGAINPMPHAWVAAEINKKWYMFDPTWAAGTVQDLKFIAGFNNDYFKKMPEEMLKDHMPFDPMLQFVNHPLYFDDFNKGNVAINTSRPYFSYADSLNAFHKMDSLEQFISVARRVSKNGEKNHMVNEMLEVMRNNQNMGESKIGYDGAVVRFKQAMTIFNRYVNLKNNRFAGTRDDKEIQQMIDEISENYYAAKKLIEPVVAVNNEQKQILDKFNTSMFNFYRRVDDEKIYLKTYFKTDRALRR